jgi:hypothetical protein
VSIFIVKGWRWTSWRAREKRAWRKRLHATNTTARVMPAPRGGLDVEQQAQETPLQLPR